MLFISSPGTPGMLENPWKLTGGCIMEDWDVVVVDVDGDVEAAVAAGDVLVLVAEGVESTPIAGKH